MVLKPEKGGGRRGRFSVNGGLDFSRSWARPRRRGASSCGHRGAVMADLPIKELGR